MNKFILVSLIAMLPFILSNCSQSKDETEIVSLSKEIRIELLSSYEIQVAEPSGLALSSDHKFLWTVSDNYSRVYKITLEGDLMDSTEFKGNDCEGVSKYKDNGLLVICERDREIVELDSNLSINNRFKIDFKGDLNSGLEGVSYNARSGRIFIVNEKNPVSLLVLDDNFSILQKKFIDFASDLSGLEFNPELNELWLLSDENKMLFRCDSSGNELDRIRIDIQQPEGLAINFKEGLIYIVSDFSEKLYVYKLFLNRDKD